MLHPFGLAPKTSLYVYPRKQEACRSPRLLRGNLAGQVMSALRRSAFQSDGSRCAAQIASSRMRKRAWRRGGSQICQNWTFRRSDFPRAAQAGYAFVSKVRRDIRVESHRRSRVLGSL